MTSREKLLALIDAARATPLEDLLPEARDVAEVWQLAQGLGLDVWGLLLSAVPSSDAEVDVLVDKLLVLGFELRGDDLAPFSLGRYGEASTSG